MNQWFYKDNLGFKKGPFSLEEIRYLHEKGIVDKSTLVCKDDQIEWSFVTKKEEVYSSLKKYKVTEVNKPSSSLAKYLTDFGFNHLDPIKFEELALKIFEVIGFKGNLTPATNDKGVDIELETTNNSKVVVQCKRYNSEQSIGSKDVRELLGSMIHFDAKCAYFITTSQFTEQAVDFCKETTFTFSH